MALSIPAIISTRDKETFLSEAQSSNNCVGAKWQRSWDLAQTEHNASGNITQEEENGFLSPDTRLSLHSSVQI